MGSGPLVRRGQRDLFSCCRAARCTTRPLAAAGGDPPKNPSPAPSTFRPYRLPPPVAPPIARQLPASNALPFCPHSKHVIPWGIRLLKSNGTPFKLKVLLITRSAENMNVSDTRLSPLRCRPDKRGHGYPPGAPLGEVAKVTGSRPAAVIDGALSGGSQREEKTGDRQRLDAEVRHPEEVRVCSVEDRVAGRVRGEQGGRVEIPNHREIPNADTRRSRGPG